MSAPDAPSLKRSLEQGEENRKERKTGDEEMELSLDTFPHEIICIIAKQFAIDSDRLEYDTTARETYCRCLFNMMLCNSSLYPIIRPLYLAARMRCVVLPLKENMRRLRLFTQPSYSTSFTHSLTINATGDYLDSYAVDQKSLLQDPNAFLNMKRMTIIIDGPAFERSSFEELKGRNIEELIVDIRDPILSAPEEESENGSITDRGVERQAIEVMRALDFSKYPTNESDLSFHLVFDKIVVALCERCTHLTELYLPPQFHDNILIGSWPELEVLSIREATTNTTAFLQRHPKLLVVEDCQARMEEGPNDLLPNVTKLSINAQCLRQLLLPVASTGRYRPIRELQLIGDQTEDQMKDLTLSSHTKLTKLGGFPLSPCLAQLPPSIINLSIETMTDAATIENLPHLPHLLTLNIFLYDFYFQVVDVRSYDEAQAEACPLLQWGRDWLRRYPSIERLSLEWSLYSVIFVPSERKVWFNYGADLVCEVEWNEQFRYIKGR
ncbi:hypothetical protein PROFUN_03420 [Planoprotostelium fungivorum]|uniref:F-box domain-containing protein n=1 Tax=Planoprotostelium fungivorum TaxID=1890364 RepID=A0A2P6NWH4_9EUKA|nr:hypothetical protein PROFUN_03420 [Planoprotostelium fungivorum]